MYFCIYGSATQMQVCVRGVHTLICLYRMSGADIKFGDLGRKTDWRIFILVNKLVNR